MSLLNVAVFSTVADFSTVCSGTPTADDISKLPIVPAAAVIFDFNSAVAGFTNFASIPSFAGVHIVLAVLLLLEFLLL